MTVYPESSDKGIAIVHQDSDILVVDKPSGLLCVPGLKEPDNLFDRVKSFFPNARVVHRLDMSTSGLVIFALNHAAQKKLGHFFESKKIEKQYLAVVDGNLKQNCGEVVAPLVCDWINRPKQIVDWHSGKSAHTFYQKISTSEKTSTMRLKPITGRTHQLRLHMLHIGHPILGDNLYNLNGSEKKAKRLLLHAWKLRFNHPISNKLISLECEANFDLQPGLVNKGI